MTDSHVADTRRGAQFAGAAGLLWAVLSLVRIPLTGEGDLPALTESAETISAFYEGLEFDVAFTVGVGMVAIGWAMLLIFVAKVADLVAGLDGWPRWVSHVMVGGAVLSVGMTFGYLSAYGAAASWATEGELAQDSFLVLHGVAWGFFSLDSVASALWTVPFGLAIVRAGLFSRTLGWALLLAASVFLVDIFVPVPTDVLYGVGVIPYLVVFMVGLIMLRRSQLYAEGVVPAAA